MLVTVTLNPTLDTRLVLVIIEMQVSSVVPPSRPTSHCRPQRQRMQQLSRQQRDTVVPTPSLVTDSKSMITLASAYSGNRNLTRVNFMIEQVKKGYVV